MPRIAHFIDTNVFGGAESVAVEMCAALNARGLNTLIYHFSNPDMEARCEVLGIKHFLLDNHHAYKNWKSLPRFIRYFRGQIKEDKISILHSHLLGSIMCGSITAALARIPHIGTLHDIYTLAEAPRRLRVLQAGTFCGTRLVAVANIIETYCRDRLWFPETRLTTIYNGVPSVTVDKNIREKMRNEIGLKPEDIALACVGRMVPLKQHALLIHSVEQLAQQLPLKLILVGDGPERKNLEHLTETLNLQSAVKFLGFRSDVGNILQAADCFTLTSETEGLSCSILEAMSHALPIIATDVGGNKELVQHDSNGFLVEQTKDAIAAAVERLCRDLELRQTFGKASRRHHNRNFSSERMISRYLTLYEGLTNRFCARDPLESPKPTQKLVFLTSIDSATGFQLVWALLEELPQVSIDILFEKPKRNLHSIVKGQWRHLRRNGFWWIPFRLAVFFTSPFQWFRARLKAQLPNLFDGYHRLKIAFPGRVQMRVVPKYHDPKTLKQVAEAEYDLGIVFGTRILKPSLFTLPKRGMINIHQGIIPQYRGMPPAFWELYNDEKDTGVSIHEVIETLDAGALVAQEKITILEQEGVTQLQTRLDELAVQMLPDTVRAVLAGENQRESFNLADGKCYTRPTVKQIINLLVRQNFTRYLYSLIP